jgi:hypothetical protein
MSLSIEQQPILKIASSRRGRKAKHTLDKIQQKLNIQDVVDTKDAVDTKTNVDQKDVVDQKDAVKISNIHIETLHFHFSEDLVERFTYFATLHRFDERKDYKENWTKWIAEEDVATSINAEIERLTAEGYKGNILDKMFKSVRYYYRKKPFEPAPPKTRKTYESFPKEVLDSIDEHILGKIKEHASNEVSANKVSANKVSEKALLSPANAFSEYKTIHQDKITDNTLEAKYKKTYKNRFFIFTKQIAKKSGERSS